MSNNGKTGDIALLGKKTYETGLGLHEAIVTANEINEEMILVYKLDIKSRDYKCPSGHATEG
jgi:hypothetical protein